MSELASVQAKCDRLQVEITTKIRERDHFLNRSKQIDGVIARLTERQEISIHGEILSKMGDRDHYDFKAAEATKLITQLQADYDVQLDRCRRLQAAPVFA